MSIENVILLGASGTLGGPILDALIRAGFTTTVLQRHSSSSSPGKGAVRILEIDDDMPVSNLETAFQGQDACIVAMTLYDLNMHLRFVDAAVKAGVKHYIPGDFGSYESSTEQALNLLQLSTDKMHVREHLKTHATNNPTFTYTSIVTGHYLDWGLEKGFLHFDLENHTADVFDDGKQRVSFSTLAGVADAVIKVLQSDIVGRNKTVFHRNFCVSQLSLLSSLEKATGIDWGIKWLESKRFIEEKKEKAQDGNEGANMDLVLILGIVEGDWEEMGFDIDDLGMPSKDLDDTIAAIVSRASKETK